MKLFFTRCKLILIIMSISTVAAILMVLAGTVLIDTEDIYLPIAIALEIAADISIGSIAVIAIVTVLTE